MQLQEEFYSLPPTYSRVRNGLYMLNKMYPQLCRVFSIGHSVLGREIYAVSVGKTVGATLFVGGTHGLEWLTTLLLLRFLDDLLYSIAQNEPLEDGNIKKTVEHHGLVIVPALNPDGIEIALRGAEGARYMGEHVKALCGGDFSLWQANARGVDINHNFNAGWEQLHQLEQEAGITGPAPTRYGGARHTSEPETCAICNFCGAALFGQLYAFHSQGEEIFFKYGEHTPPRSHLMAQLLASCSGYRLVAQEGLASHGGLKDWFIDCFHRPGFTIEIGTGKNPLPVTDLEPIYKKTSEMLALALLL